MMFVVGAKGYSRHRAAGGYIRAAFAMTKRSRDFDAFSHSSGNGGAWKQRCRYKQRLRVLVAWYMYFR
jgi:hypothetical protein